LGSQIYRQRRGVVEPGKDRLSGPPADSTIGASLSPALVAPLSSAGYPAKPWPPDSAVGTRRLWVSSAVGTRRLWVWRHGPHDPPI